MTAPNHGTIASRMASAFLIALLLAGSFAGSFAGILGSNAIGATTGGTTSTTATPGDELSEKILALLDNDSDGKVTAFEGAENWLRIVEELDQDGDGALTEGELTEALEEDGDDEGREFVEEMDENNDGVLSKDELPPPFQAALTFADKDGDDALSAEEIDKAMNAGREFIFAMEASAWIEEHDDDGDGSVELPDDEDGDELREADRDGDGALTVPELSAWMAEREAQASFEVRGGVAVMRGTIDGSTPGRVLELVLTHPEVHTIEMVEVPGSMDDVSNLRASMLIRQAGLNTSLPDGAEIASGGVDLFLAGVERTIAPSARLGVHSWGGGDHDGSDLPRSHPDHQMFIDYYEALGTPVEFYWYTLEAAPAADIHWMTPEEIELYQMATTSADR